MPRAPKARARGNRGSGGDESRTSLRALLDACTQPGKETLLAEFDGLALPAGAGAKEDGSVLGVLLTGATGFVGTHLLHALVTRLVEAPEGGGRSGAAMISPSAR